MKTQTGQHPTFNSRLPPTQVMSLRLATGQFQPRKGLRWLSGELAIQRRGSSGISRRHGPARTRRSPHLSEFHASPSFQNHLQLRCEPQKTEGSDLAWARESGHVSSRICPLRTADHLSRPNCPLATTTRERPDEATLQHGFDLENPSSRGFQSPSHRRRNSNSLSGAITRTALPVGVEF